VKNLNSTHRIEGIDTAFGLSGSLAAARVKSAALSAVNTVQGLGETVKNVLRSD
jgi:hypothetical protein